MKYSLLALVIEGWLAEAAFEQSTHTSREMMLDFSALSRGVISTANSLQPASSSEAAFSHRRTKLVAELE